jgi:transposase InsO family protein
MLRLISILQQAFLDLRCPKNGDVRAFLLDLSNKKEELSAAGVSVSDEEYRRTILRGLPEDLARFASQLLASSKAYNSSSLDVDELIIHICEEADRLKNWRNRGHQTQSGRRKDQQPDEALAATSSDAGKKGRRKGNCLHCGKAGHWVRECRKKAAEDAAAKGGQSTTTPATARTGAKPETKPVGSANAVSDEDVEGDGFFMALEGEAFARTIGADPDPDPLMSDEADSSDSESDEEEELPDLVPADWLRETEETADAVIDPVQGGAVARTEVFDSGATRHISPYRDDFSTYSPLAPPVLLSTANQQRFQAIGTGSLVVRVPNGSQETDLILQNTLHAPSVAYTLVSLGTLDVEGYNMGMGGGRLVISSPQGLHIGMIARTSRRLYRVTHEPECAHAAVLLSIMELHQRLGHIAPASARKLVASGAVTGIELDPASQEADCDACIFARSTRLPILKVRIRPPAQSFGEEIHSDLWGPASVATRKGRKYFISFTDDATRYTIAYLLRKKSDAFEHYKSFEAWAIAQGHCKVIRALRSDRGGEYLSDAFNAHLAAAGTTRRLTVHDTPQHNGIAERLNRTLLERIRAFTYKSGLPKSLWGEALRHAVWLKNRTATRALDGRTPYEALHGELPDLSQLWRWGCSVLTHHKPKDKLAGRAREGRWIGFDTDSHAHRIYWPGTRTVTTERDVYQRSTAPLEGEPMVIPVAQSTSERTVSHAPSLSPPDSPLTELSELDSTSPVAPSPAAAPAVPSLSDALDHNEAPLALRKSARTKKPSRIVRDLQAGAGVNVADEIGGAWHVEDGSPSLLEDFDGLEHALVATTSDAEALEPRSLAEAKRRPDWPLWEKAVEEELATLKAAGTWRMEEPPAGANIIGSKWVFKAKKDAAGNIARYKARLVAQGFSQVGGVDYDDTYAPVAKLASSRAIIAMANRLRLELHQVDIKGAYLNGVLGANEVLYMQHPPGYKAVDAGTRVLRLVKTLYGLKQSGRRWYQKLTSIFTSLGFSQCQVDQAVFYKMNAAARVTTVVAVHVDDCTIAASTPELVADLKDGLRKHVEVTDLGQLHWMLGIEVRRDREANTIHLSQRAYIDSILRRYHLNDLKPLSTPMDTQVRLTSEHAPASAAEFAAMRDVPYREAVGALNWAALSTRPDIAFAVATVARFAANPGPVHWEAVKRIYRYLAGTRELWLTYGEMQRALEGYTDADGSMAEDRRAITGYAFLIDGGAVSWSSKRQEIISLSTTESEYVAATHGMKEALWLRTLLSDIFGSLADATTMFSDNQSAIALARDHQYHARTKHIDVRYHWIRWVIEQGSVRLIYCPTDDMVADVLTKALPSTKVKHFAAGLGLRAK